MFYTPKQLRRYVPCRQFSQSKFYCDKGTQTTVTDGQSMIELEFELGQVKEQLSNANNNIVYLSDRVITYRYRWLEEYNRAENLDHHMPHDVCVPDIPQVADGAPSPSTLSEFLNWDEA
ncbi:hypothetical protein CY34DRAFT_18286 [Suillus luteus UH-Slu-Lm8-n1]|uniref:Uncharacterized protein n=1 Tax=Suillus luteus UH-Slu-Lm8-n1 TaxID=930992 RepID=A0A0C9Z7S4_9AGAM|nr:hypothetical protein CY34DRAFT_18286 [Suillus luteus UH-Slu-Lm8-n1]